MKNLRSRKDFFNLKAINELKVNEEDFDETKKDEVNFEKGCIMLKVPRNDEWDKTLEAIAEEDVYESEEEPNRFGVESDPHVTVLYGTHDNEIEKEDMEKMIMGRTCVSLTLTGISIFENDEFDVLKFDVESEDLMNFNKDLTDNFPYSNDYDYHPHATIAYLKKGTGKKYIKEFTEEEYIELTDLCEITYSCITEEGKEKFKFTLPSDNEESEEITENNSEEGVEDFSNCYEIAWNDIEDWMPEDDGLQDIYNEILDNCNLEGLIEFIEEHADEETLVNRYFVEGCSIEGLAEFIIDRCKMYESVVESINENINALTLSDIRSKLSMFEGIIENVEKLSDKEYEELIIKLENSYDENTIEMIERVFGDSLDHLADFIHYNQAPNTGVEVIEFLENMNEIKNKINALL